MRSNGEIKMFKLGVEADEFCVVFTSDYCDHVRKANTVTTVNKLVIGKQGGHGTGKTGKTGNLVLTFSRQGKHRNFALTQGKILRHRENIFL